MGILNPVIRPIFYRESVFSIYNFWMHMHVIAIDGVDDICGRDHRQNKPFSRDKFEGSNSLRQNVGHIIF